MSTKKTLFIIGAGASKEAHLPTGNELKNNIANLLDIQFEDHIHQSSGDPYIYNAIKTHIHKEFINIDPNPYLREAWHIADAMPQASSIDTFIDAHSDNKKMTLCGKLAIVRSILLAEKSSLLYIDNSNKYNKLNFKAIEETWYTKFMRLIAEDCSKENLATRLQSISLIIFNYDRCVEHFIYNALQNYYGITPEEAANLVNKIDIYHPYGTVGKLPWQEGKSIAFGAEVNPKVLLELTKQIKTFTEGTNPEASAIMAIRDNVLNSTNILFLGFAYHRQNMELLIPSMPTTDPIEKRLCFGTATGISDSNCEIIRNELNMSFRSNITPQHIRNDLNCYPLFDEYWRALSLSNTNISI